MRPGPSTHSSIVSIHKRKPPQCGGRGTWPSSAHCVDRQTASANSSTCSVSAAREASGCALLAGPGADPTRERATCEIFVAFCGRRANDRTFDTHLSMQRVPVKTAAARGSLGELAAFARFVVREENDAYRRVRRAYTSTTRADGFASAIDASQRPSRPDWAAPRGRALRRTRSQRCCIGTIG